MPDCLFFISTPVHKPDLIVALAANKYQRYPVDPSMPVYMQKRENSPLVYSFATLDVATTFVNRRLQVQPILHMRSDAPFENVTVTYRVTDNDLHLLHTSIEDLYSYTDADISTFVLQTHASFFLIETLTFDDYFHEAQASGCILNPFDDVHIDSSIQSETHRCLEMNYLL